MLEMRQTEVFANSLRKLRDQDARFRIVTRIRRLSLGNFGDIKPIGSGLSEMRIDYGPGYRVYFQRRGKVLVLLLVVGTKKTQTVDIARAKKLAGEWADGA